MVDPVDTGYRRTVHRQLTVQESRHRLARKIFHGQRGELRHPYREGQEDALGALGLVCNTVVLWNTRYIDAAVAQLRADGHPVRDEDVARLSPLGHAHINIYPDRLRTSYVSYQWSGADFRRDRNRYLGPDGEFAADPSSVISGQGFSCLG
jgi:Tn3 transposase DDE domain